jgi:hypothetical protein
LLRSQDQSALDLVEGSMEGSESDPSGDNQPASKLLRNMGKYKDNNALVSALRKVGRVCELFGFQFACFVVKFMSCQILFCK